MNSGFRAALLACFVLSGCDRAQETTIQPVALKGTVVSEGEFLAQPGRMLLIGDRLFVTDDMAPHLHVLDVTGGRHLSSIGKSGGGPGEFRSPAHIDQDPRRDGSFWIYDADQLRTHMGVPGATAAPQVLEVTKLDFPPGSFYFQPVLLDESTLVATGIFPQGRLVRAKRNGELIGTIGETPAAPPGQDVPVTVLQHAYTGPLERSPDGSRLALATRHADLIELYRADGTLIRKVRGASSFEPVYQVRRTQGAASMASGEDLRFGYIDLASTDEYLFALFSGDLRGDAPGRANFGKTVHVFDWDGNRVATFALPERAIAIAIAPDASQLYATHWDPKPAIHRYPIRENLPRGR